MKVPRSHKDILVKNYLKYVDYIKTDPKDDNEIIRNTVKIFYDLDDEQFNVFAYSVILDMFQIIQNILKVEQKLVPIFIHNDIEYGINPNFDDMTFGEMIDCDTDDILRQICILYRPIEKKKGNKYTIKKYEADLDIYDELKDSLTLDVYIGFISFFLKINNDILSYTLSYLMGRATDPEKKKLLEESGRGLDGFMNYATVI